MKTATKRRLKDLVLYVAICTVIIAVVIAMFAAGMSWDFFAKWICFVFVTAVLFWYYLQSSRAFLGRKSFWLLFAFLFSLHGAIWIAVFARVQHWKFIWFYPILIELVIFTFLRDKLLEN